MIIALDNILKYESLSVADHNSLLEYHKQLLPYTSDTFPCTLDILVSIYHVLSWSGIANDHGAFDILEDFGIG